MLIFKKRDAWNHKLKRIAKYSLKYNTEVFKILPFQNYYLSKYARSYEQFKQLTPYFSVQVSYTFRLKIFFKIGLIFKHLSPEQSDKIIYLSVMSNSDWYKSGNMFKVT